MTLKKISLIASIVFLLQPSCLNAQITLDTAITPQIGLGDNFWIAQISATESKYYITDTLTNTLSLYNMDFTPFITNIALPQPIIPGYYQTLYITRTLFDCDSTNIEFMYESPSGGGCASTVYIMRTDGTQLFRLDSARSDYCAGSCLGLSDMVRPIVNTSDRARLFIRYPLCGANSKTLIYSLCGTIPQSCPCDAGVPTETFDIGNINQSFVRVFPNPSSNSMTFEVSLPDNMNEYELVIFDNQSKVVIRERITNSHYKLTLDSKDFSSGNYFYSLCTKDKSFQSGKFIISK